MGVVQELELDSKTSSEQINDSISAQNLNIYGYLKFRDYVRSLKRNARLRKQKFYAPRALKKIKCVKQQPEKESLRLHLFENPN